jgi:hypothetical protein
VGAGFLLAVEHREDDWTLPAGSKDKPSSTKADPSMRWRRCSTNSRLARHPPRRPRRHGRLGAYERASSGSTAAGPRR